MTVQEKAKAYDEAIEKATIYHKQGSEDMKLMMETCFSELKESDDEKIRKAVLTHFKNHSHDEQVITYYGVPTKDILAWLEKQGEQKSVVPKFRVGDYVKDTSSCGEPIYKVCYIDSQCYICKAVDGTHLGDRDVVHFCFNNSYLRLVRQKSVEWSEEDKDILDSIIRSSENHCYITAHERDWLKSLKERVLPKPEWSEKDENHKD